jgi:glutamine synthetase
VVKTVAHRNGMAADFSPKPLEGLPGNGFHINMSVRPFESEAVFSHMIAGVLKNAAAMTAFLDPSEASYKRLGDHKAPRFVSWSHENRSQLIRIPAAVGEYRRAELRSADPTANPYLAFTLLIYAALSGIEGRLKLCEAADLNLYTADEDVLRAFEKLPESLREACALAASDAFIKAHVPAEILAIYCGR